jgi:hypothetical protein
MKGVAMEKPKGRLPGSMRLLEEGYVNTRVLTEIHMMYERKGRGSEPWYLGVVEYKGQFYNLDDEYDQLRVILALYLNGVIQKKGDEYTLIDSTLPSLRDLYQQLRTMKLATLLVNLQGRLLRVINEHELQNYNHDV